jgi:hypothetical protein
MPNEPAGRDEESAWGRWDPPWSNSFRVGEARVIKACARSSKTDSFLHAIFLGSIIASCVKAGNRLLAGEEDCDHAPSHASGYNEGVVLCELVSLSDDGIP